MKLRNFLLIALVAAAACSGTEESSEPENNQSANNENNQMVDLAAPTGVMAEGRFEGIALSWAPVEGATRYEVQRTGESEWLDAGASTEFIDTGAPAPTAAITSFMATEGVSRDFVELNLAIDTEDGDTLAYVVRAVAGQAEGPASSVVSAAREVDSGLVISWEKASDTGFDELARTALATATYADTTPEPSGAPVEYRAVLLDPNDEILDTSDPDTGTRLAVRKIDGGTAFTCATLTSGDVKCWGAGGSGRLGNGSEADRSVPPEQGIDLGGIPAVDIVVGFSHACAILEDGALRCWGSNFSGELGVGTTEDSNSPESPVDLGAAVVSAAAGSDATCAVTETGEVFCWGANDFGKLGDGSIETQREAPSDTPVDLGQPATNIIAGQHHFCALLEDGAVKCWGGNLDGQLGNGSRMDLDTPPTNPVDLGGATAIDLAAGITHTCAILDSGEVTCWGDGDNGQLGYGGTDFRTTPVTPYSVGDPATEIVASDNATCTLAAGSVKCWGSNFSGEIGAGTRDTLDAPPAMPLDVGSNIIAIGAGDEHTCAVDGEGALRCWGRAVALGNGNTTDDIGDEAGELPPAPTPVF